MRSFSVYLKNKKSVQVQIKKLGVICLRHPNSPYFSSNTLARKLNFSDRSERSSICLYRSQQATTLVELFQAMEIVVEVSKMLHRLISPYIQTPITPTQVPYRLQKAQDPPQSTKINSSNILRPTARLKPLITTNKTCLVWTKSGKRDKCNLSLDQQILEIFSPIMVL